MKYHFDGRHLLNKSQRNLSERLVRYIKPLSCFLLLIASSVNADSAIDLSPYRGKVVYLDFWASWCVPCRESFPWMNQLRQKFSADDLEIIAVNLDKEHQLAADFLRHYPADFQVIYDPEGQYASFYQIQGMPSSILFDRNGKAIAAHAGYFIKNQSTYEQQIRDAINNHE